MQKPTKQEWYKRFKDIPEEVREVMISEETADSVGNIAEKAQLEEKQISQLASVVGYVMTGFLHPRDFIPTISEEVGVSMMVARDMAREINEQIFRPVRAELKSLHGVDGGGSSSEQSAPANAGTSAPVVFPMKPHSAGTASFNMMADRDLKAMESERERKIVQSASQLSAPPPNNLPVRPPEDNGPKSAGGTLPIPPKPSQVVDNQRASLPERPVTGNTAGQDENSANKLSSVVSRPPERINLEEQKPSVIKNSNGVDPYREPIE